MKWLVEECALPIPVESTSVRFIHTPSEFYSVLMENARNAKRRIVLASLYLGTGPHEVDLVDTIKQRMSDEPDIKVKMLLDYFRGTRSGSDGSVELLKPIADDADIRFFYHPDMRGAMRNSLPQRINEIFGVQHMKFFIFDDTIIISGANLSESYFTNRQDRYMVIENNPLLIEFFESIFEVISSCSLSLTSTGSLSFEGEPSLHPITCDQCIFRKTISDELLKAILNMKQKLDERKDLASDTILCPFLQMGPFDIHHEVDILTKLFGHQVNDIQMTMSTGYLNLYEPYTDTILNKARYPLTILLASPQANGFYNASGLLGRIPSLYVYNSYELYQKMLSMPSSDKPEILLSEYNRPDWTFHAKGIWIDSVDRHWAATFVGSSNFGYRSVFRDLEVGTLLLTTDEALMRRISEERQYIMEFCSPMDSSVFLRKDHCVPMWIKMLSPSFGYLTYRIVTRRASSSAAQLNQSSSYARTNPSIGNLLRKNQRRRYATQAEAVRNPFENAEIRERLGGNRVRFIERRNHYSSGMSTTDKAISEQQETGHEEWKPVYRFNGIVKYTFLSKMKFLQTLLSAMLLPYGYYLHVNEQISDILYGLTIVGSLTAPVILFAFTRTFNRIVGVISIHENQQVVRIGHISFWGGRANTIVDIEDLLPLSYSPDSYTRSPFVRLCRHYDPSGFFLLNMTNAEIVDEKLAELVLGTNVLSNSEDILEESKEEEDQHQKSEELKKNE
ncbi:PLD-like domain-containing protein [Ditylenchus destructor]|nr:PLD-like domain-containing protein [Ditylenchus destructor]